MGVNGLPANPGSPPGNGGNSPVNGSPNGAYGRVRGSIGTPGGPTENGANPVTNPNSPSANGNGSPVGPGGSSTNASGPSANAGVPSTNTAGSSTSTIGSPTDTVGPPTNAGGLGPSTNAGGSTNVGGPSGPSTSTGGPGSSTNAGESPSDGSGFSNGSGTGSQISSSNAGGSQMSPGSLINNNFSSAGSPLSNDPSNNSGPNSSNGRVGGNNNSPGRAQSSAHQSQSGGPGTFSTSNGLGSSGLSSSGQGPSSGSPNNGIGGNNAPGGQQGNTQRPQNGGQGVPGASGGLVNSGTTTGGRSGIVSALRGITPSVSTQSDIQLQQVDVSGNQGNSPSGQSNLLGTANNVQQSISPTLQVLSRLSIGTSASTVGLVSNFGNNNQPSLSSGVTNLGPVAPSSLNGIMSTLSRFAANTLRRPSTSDTGLTGSGTEIGIGASNSPSNSLLGNPLAVSSTSQPQLTSGIQRTNPSSSVAGSANGAASAGLGTSLANDPARIISGSTGTGGTIGLLRATGSSSFSNLNSGAVPGRVQPSIGLSEGLSTSQGNSRLFSALRSSGSNAPAGVNGQQTGNIQPTTATTANGIAADGFSALPASRGNTVGLQGAQANPVLGSAILTGTTDGTVRAGESRLPSPNGATIVNTGSRTNANVPQLFQNSANVYPNSNAIGSTRLSGTSEEGIRAGQSQTSSPIAIPAVNAATSPTTSDSSALGVRPSLRYFVNGSSTNVDPGSDALNMASRSGLDEASTLRSHDSLNTITAVDGSLPDPSGRVDSGVEADSNESIH